MKRAALIFFALIPSISFADPRTDFDSALAKWRKASVASYSFDYMWAGAVVVAPRCAGALVRVYVVEGRKSRYKVVRGNSRCPRGTRNIDFSVPATLDEAFAEVSLYVVNPPAPAKVTVSYDESFGYPVSYRAEKLDIPDNDEGFSISGFKVAE